MIRLRRFKLCNWRAGLRRWFPKKRSLRGHADLRSLGLYEDGTLYIFLPDDICEAADLQILTIEYIGWDKPRKCIAIPMQPDRSGKA